MKSLLALAVGAALLGCGQTGPLYMPKPPVRPAVVQPVIPMQAAPLVVPPTTDNGIPTTIPVKPAVPQPPQSVPVQ